MYDSLSAFMDHHTNIDVTNGLFKKLGIAVLTKDDLELLSEYMLVLKPLAAVLDILQGEKACFMGLGVVLPLLTRLKKQLEQKVFPHLGPIRDRILDRIEYR